MANAEGIPILYELMTTDANSTQKFYAMSSAGASPPRRWKAPVGLPEDAPITAFPLVDRE